jgi:cyclopropane-fatty-acyl-phospholipid synthase
MRAAAGEEFCRTWELYLAGSEAAFRTGWMQLFQVVFAPRESPPPFLTRTALYVPGNAPDTTSLPS